MALLLKNAKGQLAATATTILDVSVNQTWIIQNITIHNGDAAAQSNIKFYIFPDGGSASASTIFINIGSLNPGETRQINLKHNLNSKDILSAEAGTASKVNYIVSYAERTD
ncbi:MAG: hypothetical protein JKY52_08580 [Flavobacteriales bacterium]|nr:hypothetical protein [Flavobacteriales bacterium]